MLKQVPRFLTLLRAGLAPVVVLLALVAPVPVAFAACLAVAAVSDYFDGAIARHLHIVTPGLRRLDSLVDLLFHLAALFALWWLYPQVIARHTELIAVLCGLGVARYGFSYAKFGREASYHLWSSKVWGFALFLAFYSLLVLQSDGVGITLVLALGILAGLEDLVVSVVLREWRADVPTVFHAWRLRNSVGA